MALISEDFDPFFRRVVRAIEPYVPDLVIAGGCANALYRHHPYAAGTMIPAPGTKDLDLACEPAGPPLDERAPLIDLLRGAGLKPILLGQTHPPVMKFSIDDVRNGPDLEILCPMMGPPRRTGDREVQAVEIQGGSMTAQPLRYLNLLLIQPWSIDLACVPGFADMAGLPPLRIPQPLTYIMQKVLARREAGRSPEKLEKDCYYIYEISVVFRDAFDHVVAVLPVLGRASPSSWVDRFVRDVDSLFRSPQAEGPVSAVRVARAASIGHPDPPRIDEILVHVAVGRMIAAVKGSLGGS